MKKVAPPQATRHTISGCRLDVEMELDQGKVTALNRPGVNENTSSGRNVRVSPTYPTQMNELGKKGRGSSLVCAVLAIQEAE